MSSFAYDLKNELYKNRPQQRPLQLAQLYGLLLFSRSFGAAATELHTEHEKVADLYDSLLRELIIPLGAVDRQYQQRRGARGMYCVAVREYEDRLLILDTFSHRQDEPNLRIHRQELDSDEAFAAFLSGAYLACGNMTDPSKGYHLEFVTPHHALSKDLEQLLCERFVPPKMTQRRGNVVLYYKESEPIEDLMTLMGAANSSLKLMNVKIYKDVRNKVNRVTNCETANIEKTVTAAAAQIEDIQLILKQKGLEYLSEDLRELAVLRLENPEYSLSELTEAMGEAISKSGINHRLKRIAKIAGELRGTK